MNCEQMVEEIFYDLQKAFDYIKHTVLLDILKYYGVLVKFYSLVKSYLDGRYQKVILSHSKYIESTWKETNQGVLQD
jgi:hypothetical protein